MQLSNDIHVFLSKFYGALQMKKIMVINKETTIKDYTNISILHGASNEF